MNTLIRDKPVKLRNNRLIVFDYIVLFQFLLLLLVSLDLRVDFSDDGFYFAYNLVNFLLKLIIRRGIYLADTDTFVV